MKRKIINIIVADDHQIVRAGVRSIIGESKQNIKIIAEYANGIELLKDSPQTRADIYLLDLSMPKLNGIETAKRLIEASPNIQIIILSMHSNKILVGKALKIGVKGYVLKENTADELISAINEVSKGKFFFSKQIREFVNRQYRDKNCEGRLTKRENEILQLIATGLAYKEISEQLNISSNTVHSHIKSIMNKLDLHKQTSLVRYAMKQATP